jgi:hypothetical protein
MMPEDRSTVGYPVTEEKKYWFRLADQMTVWPTARE